MIICLVILVSACGYNENDEADEDMAETEETAVETAPEEAEDDAFDGESEDDTTDEN